MVAKAAKRGPRGKVSRKLFVCSHLMYFIHFFDTEDTVFYDISAEGRDGFSGNWTAQHCQVASMGEHCSGCARGCGSRRQCPAVSHEPLRSG